MIWIKRSIVLCLCLITAIFLVSRFIEIQKEPHLPNDIITQKIIRDGRIPVTVLVKYAFSINEFERIVEERFPEIDIIQIGNYTRDRGIVEYERRLKHDDLPDIVMTWPLDVGKKYWEERLIDLSIMPFTNKYNNAMLNKIAKDGRLYYLPGPAQVRGIVYNKTLFAENGWLVPYDFDSFVELCKKIEASGIRSIQLGFGNSEVFDTAFVGFSYGNCFSTPEHAEKIAEYNDRKGSFGDHFGPALDTFQVMIDAGIWKKEDINVTYSGRENMFFSRQCAMIEDSVLMVRMGNSRFGSKDEFALMPFFSTSLPNDWGRIYMVCYIGLNKHLTEPQNKKKYDLVLKIMDYISTPEGQTALAADTGAMYSSVKNALAPDIPEILQMRSTLRHGRSAIFPELQNAQGALREGLAGMLSGKLSKSDVIKMVDQQNVMKNVSAVSKEVLGTASENFSLVDTGNFVTDVMREKSGAEIALFFDNGKDGKFNGKGISARFYKGEITLDDILCVLPDMKQNEVGALQVVEMKGIELIRTLEHSIHINNNLNGWFYYFSGLKMEYSLTAESGSRIINILTSDGRPVDMQKIYTVAVMDGTFPEDAALSVKDMGVTMQDILVEEIRSRKVITPSKDGRFIIPSQIMLN